MSDASLWSAFRRDRLAVLGLGIVTLVTLACVAAPLIAPDATAMRPWVGAVAPLSRVPDVPAELDLTPGTSAPLAARSRIELHIDPGDGPLWRLAMRRGVLEIRAPDARLATRLDIPIGSVVVGPQGDERLAQPERLLAGHVPPAWLLDAARPVRYLRLPGSAPTVVHAVVTDGRISSIDGPALVRGDTVRRALVDGRAHTRLHLLGTDLQGRDLWARTLYGGRISLLVGLVATLVALCIGVLYGAIAGWRGGRTDAAMLGAINVLDALPFLFLVILLMTLVGNNLYTLFAALGAVQWLTTARIVRAQVLALAGGDMVAAARSLGLPAHRILLHHLVPSCIGPVIVFAALTVPAVILEESFLAFIGLQVQHDGLALDSWGALVAQGMAALGSGGDRAWLLLVPASVMTATLLALNLVGDGLRAALDPRLARMAR
jgi:oligopeptide transport system permease protein